MSRGSKLALALVLGWIALAALAPLVAPYPYWAQDRSAVMAAPSAAGHLLGTDPFGRDVWSRLLYATQVSTLLALAMALPPLLLALAVGAWAALAPRTAGWWRMGGEVSRSLPWIFLLVAVRAALPLNATRAELLTALIVLFTLAAWPVTAWAFFGAARDLAAQDFVTAARALGATRRQLLWRHLLPNLRPLAATYLALLFAAATIAEVSLALVGLGLPDPLPTWGNMLLPLRQMTVADRAWWLFAPLAVLLPLLCLLNLFAHRQARASAA